MLQQAIGWKKILLVQPVPKGRSDLWRAPKRTFKAPHTVLGGPVG